MKNKYNAEEKYNNLYFCKEISEEGKSGIARKILSEYEADLCFQIDYNADELSHDEFWGYERDLVFVTINRNLERIADALEKIAEKGDKQ